MAMALENAAERAIYIGCTESDIRGWYTLRMRGRTIDLIQRINTPNLTR